MNTDLVKMFLGSVVRQGLTALGTFLTLRGIPKLADGTVSNLTDVIVGVSIFTASLIWSWLQKHLHLRQLQATTINPTPTIKIQQP